MLRIKKISARGIRASGAKDVFYLTENTWDDYGFKTQFFLSYFDKNGKELEIGSLKIGCADQVGGRTHDLMKDVFEELDSNFFSLGLDAEYYLNIRDKLPADVSLWLLAALRDVAKNESILALAEKQEVFKTSLMRGVSWAAIKIQYQRILAGGDLVTDYNFVYSSPAAIDRARFYLEFSVDIDSKPSSNMHVLIGRNGVGKTSLLNNMAMALVGREDGELHGGFHAKHWNGYKPLDADYFSSVVSVSFSAFDPFSSLEFKNRSDGIGYFYIGLKEFGGSDIAVKTAEQLTSDFSNSLGICLRTPSKTSRWLKALSGLGSDDTFYEMSSRLAEVDSSNVGHEATNIYSGMSSGHRIVLLTITKLVETIEEKTLVLIDEPESHLHPPLLSAFTRTLSELLLSRNAVAIIATHSPVVLQEISASCVWKLRRSGAEGIAERPSIETFGENVGVLTREIFGLEVSMSGFHDLLKKSVDGGGTYSRILEEYNNRIGFEGQAILSALIAERDSGELS